MLYTIAVVLIILWLLGLASPRRLAQLCQDLARQYPIEAVTGHEHIAPGRKLDPGPGFDWSLLQRHTGWPDTRFVCRAQA